MPDLTIIQGGGGRKGPNGGPRSPRNDNLSYHLNRLVIEILRGLARGHDNGRIAVHLLGITESLDNGEGPLNQTIHAMLVSYAFVEKEIDDPWPTPYTRELVRQSFMAAAEERCDDGAAAGRFSQRLRNFEQAISLWIEERELLSRKDGGSYLEQLKKNFRL